MFRNWRGRRAAQREARRGERVPGTPEPAPPLDEDDQPDIADESFAARDPIEARVGRAGGPRRRPLEDE
jgi:hypothetical protein